MKAKKIYENLVAVKIRFDINDSHSQKTYRSIRHNAMKVIKEYKKMDAPVTADDIKYTKYLKTAEISIKNMRNIVSILNKKIK